jgi:hypothetical protein
MSDKPEQPTASFQYLCRRCSAAYSDTHTAEHNGITMLQDAIEGVSRYPMSPKMLSIHVCLDDGRGIADLIGYKKTR